MEFNREQAYHLLTKYLSNKNLLKHCLACEGAMKALFDHLHPEGSIQEREVWGITGLLHDVDYELAQNTDQLDQHGLLIFEKEPGVIPPVIEHAIKAHNFENTGVNPESDMDWAIAIVDGLTGFIVSCALIHPERSLNPLTVEFVTKRLSQPAFSRNVRRDIIELCESKLGISHDEFIATTLTAMKGIHADLGL